MQLALTYDASTEGSDDWTAVRAWFSRAVSVIGHKEVAYRLDIGGSNLTDAIKEAERKEIKGRWISVVLCMCPETLVREYLEIVTGQHGYEAPKKARVLTAEEELRETRALLQREAPGVLALLDKELGR